MAYIQKNNPIPRTSCGRRRAEQMTNPFKKETQMEVDPNAETTTSKSKYSIAVDPKMEAYNKLSTAEKIFKTPPNITAGVVPFGGGKIGKLYKAGKKIYDKIKSPNKKISKASLNKMSKQLKKASKLHAGQAAKIDKATSAMKKLKPCQKAAAKRKFDVYPSAYANMWASNHKC